MDLMIFYIYHYYKSLSKDKAMFEALIGGAMIGIAVSFMLIANGRVTGISGITSGLLNLVKHDIGWRIAFLLGLFSGGATLMALNPELFALASHTSNYDYLLAGLLVGFGTVLGSGCTSGHGVCGISRLSKRSIASTLIFILFGMISVLFFKMLRGSL
jgi:uncharacterized membrane protein YedE/YeeE